MKSFWENLGCVFSLVIISHALVVCTVVVSCHNDSYLCLLKKEINLGVVISDTLWLSTQAASPISCNSYVVVKRRGACCVM